MKTDRNPKRHVAAETLREAIINHAYSTNLDNSIIAGIRQASDLWLLARRDQPLESITSEVKIHETDPDISRITNDLQHSAMPMEETSNKVVKREQPAVEQQVDWMMV